MQSLLDPGLTVLTGAPHGPQARRPRARRFTYRVGIAYDGAPFYGFARQPGLPTVESALLAALQVLVPELPGFAVGGRTDKGVHAVGQVISFYAHNPLDPAAVMAAIDSAHASIVGLSVTGVSRSFHARYSASCRRYAYFLPDPERSLDLGLLNRLLYALVGRRSFSAFARDTQQNANLTRTLYEARARQVRYKDRPAIRFDFRANGFLRAQVRTMVSTAVREALLGADDARLVSIAATEDRRQSAPPAPAHGLYLCRIGYPPQAPRRG